MPKEHTRRLQQAVNAVIANQLRDRNPPATGETLARLLAGGHSEEEAMRLIGLVVAAEVIAVLHRGAPYDEARYVAALNGLPDTLPRL
ncbi:MAG: hypothetical protein OEV91_01670 [Desulfobulbaceae bacterium]|nr:hypothetical protein [Desulfobulbaceae bacterium]